MAHHKRRMSHSMEVFVKVIPRTIFGGFGLSLLFMAVSMQLGLPPAPAVNTKATNINESLAQFDLKRDKLKLLPAMQHEQNYRNQDHRPVSPQLAITRRHLARAIYQAFPRLLEQTLGTRGCGPAKALRVALGDQNFTVTAFIQVPGCRRWPYTLRLECGFGHCRQVIATAQHAGRLQAC